MSLRNIGLRLVAATWLTGLLLLFSTEPVHANVIFPPQMLAALNLWIYPLSALIEATAITLFLRRYFTDNHGRRLSLMVIFCSTWAPCLSPICWVSR